MSYLSWRLCSNSARFLWKSIPPSIKENQADVNAAWKIGQKLWSRDYGGVHEAICEFDWSPEVQGLVTAFSGKHLRRHPIYHLCEIHAYNLNFVIIFCPQNIKL